MNDSSVTSRAPPRESTTVTCSACNTETTVPFKPTPGRPVFCRDCFAKRNNGPGGAGGPGGRGGPGGPRPRFGAGPGGAGYREVGNGGNRPTKKRMLAQGRKAHFVYDALEVLTNGGGLAEDQRRGFVEMLFTRGSRQSTEAARDFLIEKSGDNTISENEGKRLARLIDQYSFYR